MNATEPEEQCLTAAESDPTRSTTASIGSG